MEGMDAGRAIDLGNLGLDLPAALVESYLGLRSEVERRNRDLDPGAQRAGCQGGLADDLRIIDRPDDRIIGGSREHAIDFGVQLLSNLFAVSREQILAFRLGNAIAVQDTVAILCELSA